MSSVELKTDPRLSEVLGGLSLVETDLTACVTEVRGPLDEHHRGWDDGLEIEVLNAAASVSLACAVALRHCEILGDVQSIEHAQTLVDGLLVDIGYFDEEDTSGVCLLKRMLVDAVLTAPPLIDVGAEFSSLNDVNTGWRGVQPILLSATQAAMAARGYGAGRW